MPAPVTFEVSLASLPSTFEYTPQQLAVAIAERMTVTPSVPWSSFLNGATIPTSDNGPVLYNGKEWLVWDSGTGAYVKHVQNGSGLVDATVTKAKMASGTAGSVLIFDGTGRPVELTAASGTDGQVVTLVSGAPVYADTYVPGKVQFEAALTADQALNTSGTTTVVSFDAVKFDTNVTFNTADKRIPVTANSFWFFYVALQIEDTGAASTDVQIDLKIRLNGGTGPGQVVSYPTSPSRFGLYTGGIVQVASDGYVDVAISATENTPVVGGLTIAANSDNTRFGGFRIL